MNPTKIFFLFTFLLLSTSQLIRLPLQTRPQPPKSFLKTHNIRFNAKAGKIPIKNYLDINYCGQVNIGAQKTKFDLILDTGSSYMWIPDASIKEAQNTFNCSESETCKMDKEKIIPLFYGLGYAIGYHMVDQLDLGGLVISDFSMISAFALHSIQLGNYDGLIGLALGRQKQDFPTVLERLKENNLISTGSFSMYLGTDPEASGSLTGELIFGGFDPKYAQSEFQYVNVRKETESMYWSTDLSALGYGASTNLSSLRNVPVIFDSGTSLLILPEDFILGIAFQAGKAGFSCEFVKAEDLYKCDCAAKEKLEDLVFYFGDVALRIPPSSYIYTEDGLCYLAMQKLDGGQISVSNPVVLGDFFLKNFYMMYTADNYTVGFAKASPLTKSVFPMWIVFVGGGVILLAVAAGFIGYFYKKAQKKKLHNKSSYAEWGSRHENGLTTDVEHLEHSQY